MKKTIITLVCVLGLIGCKDKNDVHSSWMGKWNGPEGTYLELSAKGDKYSVVVANLDGPLTFEGVASEGGISFVRDGKTETIKAGNGVDTGMKWLAEKQDCLIINPGEGFCRDMQHYNGMGEPGEGMDLPKDMK